MKRPLKEQFAFLTSRLIGRIVLLLLALLIVIGIAVGTSLVTHSTSKTPTTPTHSAQHTDTNTIQYDNIQQTPTSGATRVDVTLVEFTITSSLKTFQAGHTYYFVVANRGHVVHEFLIMPENPDGSPASPAVQYNDKLIEIEQIAPGTTMTLNYTFPSSAVARGRYEIACQMRGHYQAGMRLPIRVVA